MIAIATCYIPHACCEFDFELLYNYTNYINYINCIKVVIYQLISDVLYRYMLYVHSQLYSNGISVCCHLYLVFFDLDLYWQSPAVIYITSTLLQAYAHAHLNTRTILVDP